jgi:2-methylcitrate dehydratase PrpD
MEYESGGGDVKRLYGSLGAMGGIRGALLAAKKLTAPETILEGNKGVLQAYGNEPRE